MSARRTDRLVEAFLSRWSQRKRQAADTATPESESRPAAKDATTTEDTATPPVTVTPDAPPLDPKGFDPTTLPPIESITAETDISAFLAPGVPSELKREALRRAWAADPKIRDFVGLAENAWDYHAPGSMPGFGPLEMTDELRRMVARIVGEEGEADRLPGTIEPILGNKQDTAHVPGVSENAGPCDTEPPTHVGQSRDCDDTTHAADPRVALQTPRSKNEDLQAPARLRHGGALPKS
jgi:Protein of unknown function (DUF3306)